VGTLTRERTRTGHKRGKGMGEKLNIQGRKSRNLPITQRVAGGQRQGLLRGDGTKRGQKGVAGEKAGAFTRNVLQRSKGDLGTQDRKKVPWGIIRGI